jgi:type IV pilus assembly protein PilN
MAHINLLPWREELREERQKQFYTALVAGLVFAAIVLYLVIAFANSLIEEQNERNAFLQQEIASLDKKIKEIKSLEDQRSKLIARMEVIQDLQQSRPKAVKVFDAIVRSVPDGTHLNSVSRVGKTLNFNGEAESNARVSVFMRELDANQEFEESKLQVVQSSGKSKRSFTVSVDESKPESNQGGE